MSSILILVSLPVLLLLAWFGLEYGRMQRFASMAKAAADAAALAAAARYADGVDVAKQDAAAAAAEHGGPNGPLVLVIAAGPGGGEDLEFGDWDPDARAFSMNADGGRAVRATVVLTDAHPNGAVPLALAGFFGIPPVSMHRASIAVYNPPKHTTSLLLPDAAGSTLAVSGTANLVARGGVSVANTNPGAASAGVHARLDVPVLRVAGILDEDSKSRVQGSVIEGAGVPADPFSGVAMPVIAPGSGIAIEVDPATTVHVPPGVHAALSVSSGIIVLDHGFHQFDGGIALSGTAVLELADATVQLQGGASLSVTDAAVLRGTCASGHPSWDGYSLVQGPGAAAWSVTGGGSLRVAGRAYGPGAHLAVSGAAEARLPSAVLRSVALGNDARLRLTSDIAEIALPGVPGRARLVQ